MMEEKQLMTARSQFNRRLRWIGGAIYAGFALCILGGVISAVSGESPYLPLVLPGFALTFVMAMMAHFFFFRCPWCSGNLAPVLFARAWPWMDPAVSFCAYCGRGLDDELPATVGNVETDRRGLHP
jgi:hypothetical protein